MAAKRHSIVMFGDDSFVEVEGKGCIKINARNEFMETISNVLYVLALKTKLLSVRQLQVKGYMISIEYGVCDIYDE